MMENVPRTVFSSILKYATNNKTLLKKVATWERVSTQLSKRLIHEFWPTVQNTDVQFFGVPIHPIPMQIGSEIYESIDISVLKYFRQRGMRRIRIVFGTKPTVDYYFPLDFAASVPEPASIHVGQSHNLNDPELLALLQMYCDVLEGFTFWETNETLNDYFVNAVCNFKSLKQLKMCSWTMQTILTPYIETCPENRDNLYKNLVQLHFQCLVIISNGTPSLRGIYDNELFTLLEENRTIKCLHFTCLNHYVERWLANSALHNRAQITNLCISNDQFGYNFSELQNRYAPLFHTVADYQLLFPKLKYICIGICLMQLDENQLESIMMCYFHNSSSNIQLHLTVRLFHKLQEIPFLKLDRVLTKLQSLQAEINVVNKNKRDGVINIRSKNGRISSEIIICFHEKDNINVLITRRPMGHTVFPEPEIQKCIDYNHCGSHSMNCLCAIN